MTRTLNDAIDDLVNAKRILLFKDENGHNIRGDVPSLIDQLEAAVERGGSNGGGGRMGSRPPIAVGVVQLINEIATKTAAAVMAKHKSHLHNITKNLRRIAGDRAALQPTDPDVIEWTGTVDGWVRSARSALGIEPKYPAGIRGARCPSCGADYTWGTDDVGERTRVPVLQFTWTEPGEVDPDQLPEDRKIRAVQCVMCGETWWAGAQFWQLQAQINAVVQQNLEHETLGA